MLLHEHQAKTLLRQHGVTLPPGQVVASPEEAEKFHASLGDVRAVVKAQILAGGRGKAGGIKRTNTPQETRAAAKTLLGAVLKTHQTGPKGEKVHALLIEQACEIQSEFYLAFTIDRSRQCPVLLFSSEGGVEIESVNRDNILTQPLDPAVGLAPFHVRNISAKFRLEEAQSNQLFTLADQLLRFFVWRDLSLLEINPLVWTKDNVLLPLDAKLIVDDNALFRHKDLAALKDPSQEDERERQAAVHNLSYIRLDGSIGCMVNGAGLAMATMDIIKLHGGEPANFLDVGGGANTEQVTEAFKILLSDPHVKAVLVNIFGGIMKCDVIAKGILEALKQVELKVPLVVRLEGTRVDLGRKILRESGLPLLEADTMDDAAQKAVKAAG
jgi:succinyl-CoA synthetase beta subunit